MAAVTVSRLRMRRPLPGAADARFRIEDALRTEVPASERLVLVRRMRLPGEALPAPPWRRAEMMRAAYAAAASDARHGSSSAAADANCVWFESPTEARRLLLRALLRGQAVRGWFWRLAVPDWNAMPLDVWLPQLFEMAVARRDDAFLLMVAEEVVAADAVTRLVAVLSREPAQSLIIGASPAPRVEAAQREGRDDLLDAPGGEFTAREFGLRVVAGMSPGLRALLQRLATHAPASAHLILPRVVEAVVLRVSPALALNPVTRARVRQAVVAILAAPPGAPRTSAPPPKGSRPHRPAKVIETPLARSRIVANPEAPPSSPPALKSGSRAPPAPVEPSEPVATSSLVSLWPESRAAGLWLVVPSLIHLGFPQWLADGGVVLEDDPGRALLRYCGLRHRVDPRDPALASLPPLDDEAEPAPWLEAWRRGLDGWLRRRARTSLHDLIWRRGWLCQGEERLLVRYPLASADIRLRRHALDVDPGWVAWLGVSVRYRFSDEPLP